MALKRNNYRGEPIRSPSRLAYLLKLREADLFKLAQKSADFWRPGKLLAKKNSSDLRATHDALPELKSVHELIKERILKDFNYPPYLLGGISDPWSPRGCKQHAKIHCGKHTLISEDIENFFPSTTSAVIHDIWVYQFHSSQEVADLLTQLTTYNDFLPQGWKTSSYLANLVLGQQESSLVSELHRGGYAYSRFVDDITVSSMQKLGKKHKSDIIRRIYRMLLKKGYRPKRKKHEIVSRNSPMLVTGLTVNKSDPKLSKLEQNKIRAALHQAELAFRVCTMSPAQYQKHWDVVNGRVSHLTAYHPSMGKKFRVQLTRIRPSVYMQLCEE
ncbi:MAG: reverse transcriptase family protein [Halieaceae bacterium]